MNAVQKMVIGIVRLDVVHSQNFIYVGYLMKRRGV